jgi:enoyl-CoA hydratase/carnithine racemase
VSEDVLIYEKRDAVAWLILNRPEDMNALNLDMIGLFEKYLPEICVSCADW